MNGIFISYRRDDSAGYAGRLYDRLVAAFGAERVFMDVEGIELGTDFVAAIERALDASTVFIALIGKEWSQAADASGRRRLDDPHDFIRLETTMALARKLRVVPVLVDDAAMPRAEELPPELAVLTRRQAIEINHRQWEASTGALIQALKRILDAPTADGLGSTRSFDRDGRRTMTIAAAMVAIVVAIVGAISWNRKQSAAPPPASPPVQVKQQESPIELATRDKVTAPAAKPAEPARAESQTKAAPPVSPSPRETVTAPKPPQAKRNEKRRDVDAASTPPATSNAPAATDAETRAPVRAEAPTSESASTPLPIVGERWIYRLHSKWPANKDQTFQFAVTAIDGDLVTLALTRLGDEPQSLGRQRARGKTAELIDWAGIGWEFSPFIGAFGGLGADANWRMQAPEPSGFIGKWNCRAESAGREQVRVPAGEFDAVKLAMDCNRAASGSVAEKSVEPVWIHLDAWYAAEAKRYVRLVRRVVTVDRTEADKDVIELLEHRRAAR